jgi:outer membrane protein assembly factor BamE (lipoprotein component of BamABCDE complex)
MKLARTPASVPLLMAATALGLVLAGCSPTIDQRGNLPEPEAVLAVQPGIHDRTQVAEILGSPSTMGTFNDKTWYYISKRTETVAFFDPDVIDQEVLVVRFDDAGVVNDMKVYGLEDGRLVEPVDRVTPTYGNELTIVQQLIGNLGRFTGDGAMDSAAPTSRPGQ